MQNLGQRAINGSAENRQVLNLLPIPIAILSGEQHRIDFANDAMFAFWRRERSDQTIERPLAEAFPEVDPTFVKQLALVLHTGVTYKDEEVLLTMNDQFGNPYSIFIDYTYQPILDDHSKVIGVLVTAQDISHKVSAKKTLQATSDMLEQSNRALIASNQECIMVIETAKLGTWKLDAAKSILATTDRGVEICGLTDNLIALSDFTAIVSQDYQDEVVQAFEDAIRNGTDFELEIQINLSNTSDRWIRLNGKRNEQQTSILSGTILDITHQKMEVIRKNQFIGMVSHELKTPLTSLAGMLQLVDRKVNSLGDIHLQHILQKSLHQVRKMTHMINSFVNVSRLESGKFELELTDFDMEELVGEYLSEAMLTAPQYQFIQHDCQTVKLKADRMKIGAVLANMVSNAIKYSPQGSPITINCKVRQRHLEIAVKDQGCGIAESDKERVFERFSHIDNPHIMHSAGFGIGLYLCSEIIKHHNGEIWVENNTDAGCTFHFKLPLS